MRFPSYNNIITQKDIDMKVFTMNKLSIILIAIAFLSISLSSCNNQRTKVQYETAEGYFILNTVKNDGAYEKKFSTKEEFDSYFGTAATMSSLPTPIDFDKKFAAAYILPVTNTATTINVDSVIWNGNKTEMWLSIKSGDELSYSTRPVKIILIDKKYGGDVTTYVTGYDIKNN